MLVRVTEIEEEVRVRVLRGKGYYYTNTKNKGSPEPHGSMPHVPYAVGHHPQPEPAIVFGSTTQRKPFSEQFFSLVQLPNFDMR